MRTFLNVTLPVGIILAYRLIPVRARRLLSKPPGTSTHALAVVRAGGGWAAFWRDALPRRSAHGGPFDWAHYR